MSLLKWLRDGNGLLLLWGLLVAVISVAFVTAKTMLGFLVVTATACAVVWALVFGRPDDATQEETEFGAEFDALQAADRKIVDIRTRAACAERLAVARYEAERAAVLGNRAGADV